MLRSSRPVVSLICSLVMGTATTTTATVLVASSLIGCQDESQPEYWTGKLDDAAWKARAVATGETPEPFGAWAYRRFKAGTTLTEAMIIG